MTELEKMEALKRVYAEMILKAAKDAAARVMVAESKARRFEQDLIYTRDEASRLLHRSKELIDAQAKLAEIRLLNQQTKFDELESQLNETEGMILDLRAELEQAREELDKDKKKALNCSWQNGNEKAASESDCGGYEQFTSSLDSGLKLIPVNGNSSFPQGSTLNLKSFSPAKETVDLNSECDVYSSENNLVFTHIEEPELLGNDCTHNMCAAEASLVNEISYRGEKSGPRTRYTNLENVNSVENAPVFEEKVQHGKYQAVSVARRSIRKRRIEHWGHLSATFGVRTCHQFKRPHRAFRHFSHHKSNKFGLDKFQTDGKTQIEESINHVQELPSIELKLTKDLQEDMELIDVLVELDIEDLQNVMMQKIDLLVEQDTYNLLKDMELIDVLIEQDIEDLHKDMELVDVLVEEDELAAMFDLNSSSRIVCEVESATVTKASDVSCAGTIGTYKYTYSRRKKKNQVFP